MIHHDHMDHVQKARLPATELGENRCFEIGYFGHGDIVMALWEGDVNHDPTNQDGISKQFGMAHGSDVLILASLAGYLARCGRSEREVAELMVDVGRDVLNNDPDRIKYRSDLNKSTLDLLSIGQPYSRYDLPQHNRECLLPAIPSQPGLLEEVGGTGIYTTQSASSKLLMSLIRFRPDRHAEDEKVKVVDSADFCEEEVPTMARMVCDLALGEYELDIQYFLTRRYVNRQEG